MMFRLKLWWINNRDQLVFTLAYVLAISVGLVGLVLMAFKEEKPMIPVQVVVSDCDFSAKQIVPRQEVEKCLKRVTYLADPNMVAEAKISSLDSANNLQPVFRQIPASAQYRVTRPIAKGMAVNGTEFEPYVESDRFVLVQIETGYATSEVVVFHIRKSEILSAILGNASQSPNPLGNAAGGAVALPAVVGFQLRIEGHCVAIVGGKCAFVMRKAEVLDPDGNVVKNVNAETALAVLQEVSGSQLVVDNAQPLPQAMGGNPSGQETPAPPPGAPQPTPAPSDGQ